MTTEETPGRRKADRFTAATAGTILLGLVFVGFGVFLTVHTIQNPPVTIMADGHESKGPVSTLLVCIGIGVMLVGALILPGDRVTNALRRFVNTFSGFIPGTQARQQRLTSTIVPGSQLPPGGGQPGG